MKQWLSSMNQGHANEQRTNKMPPFLHNPGSWAVEAVIITRREIYDSEEKGISWLDVLSRGNTPSSVFYLGLDTHLQRNRSIVHQRLLRVPLRSYRSINLVSNSLWEIVVLCR